jgi:hypothetical protein
MTDGILTTRARVEDDGILGGEDLTQLLGGDLWRPLVGFHQRHLLDAEGRFTAREP